MHRQPPPPPNFKVRRVCESPRHRCGHFNGNSNFDNLFISYIEALHGHVTNTKFSKFLLKLLENFRTLKNIARYDFVYFFNFVF